MWNKTKTKMKIFIGMQYLQIHMDTPTSYLKLNETSLGISIIMALTIVAKIYVETLLILMWTRKSQMK